MEPSGFSVGVAKVAFGVEKETVLVRLNASPTSWNLILPSLKAKVRETFASMLKKPGPRNRSRPLVPNVPTAGFANAVPSKYGVLASCPPRIATDDLT